MKFYERFLNVLSWIGFLALVPVGLALFDIDGPLDFLQSSLGRLGTPSTLTIVFLALVLLRVLFGKSERYAPILIALVVSFLLLAAVVEFSFMRWYKATTDTIVYLDNHRLVFLIAVAVVIVGILLGRLKRLSWVVQVFVLILVPLALIVLAHIYGFASLGEPASKTIVLPPSR